ncbi:MAG: pentapeptide repeat-containing protein [Candidatus Latescibacteria bacterium]|nr:pentapeptide repeat-containing protein [Candidatus Latescibacterota bacterium]
MSSLPPGQTETRKFPTTGETAPLASMSLENWRLIVEGVVDAPFTLTYPEFLTLPQRTLVMDVHCVTGWSHLGMAFEGLPLADLLDRARPQPNARFVEFIAYSARGHDTSLPLDVAREQCWLIHSADGAPLTPAHGFPLRVVTPGKYFYKSLKWVHRIVLLEQETLGFWERESAYHNHADPWNEERYDDRARFSREATRAFRQLETFDAYRQGRPQDVVLKANLSNWTPRTRDLHGLQLKSCNFRGADLSHANLRGANLTRSVFRGASLRDADLTGADLEGADFSGADLTGARLVDAALSSTTFFRITQKGAQISAMVDGMIVRGCSGLLEAQEAFLMRFVEVL